MILELTLRTFQNENSWANIEFFNLLPSYSFFWQFLFFFCNLISDNGTTDFKALSIAWNVSVFAVILVRIFPQSDWIRRDTLYLSIFSPNAGKYGPESLRLGTLFTQWLILNNFQQVEDSENFNVFNFLWSFVIFFESTLITCQLLRFYNDDNKKMIILIKFYCYYFIYEYRFSCLLIWTTY